MYVRSPCAGESVYFSNVTLSLWEHQPLWRRAVPVVRDIKLAIHNIQAVLSANGVQPGVWEVDESLRPTSPIDAPRSSWRDFTRYFGKWENLRVLIGCSYSWFALDVRP